MLSEASAEKAMAILGAVAILARTRRPILDGRRGLQFEKFIGGDWHRPDDGEPSCMSRTPVGLVNHPVP